MTTTVSIRLMVTAALLVSPIAASAQNNPNGTTKLAQNSVASAPTPDAPKAAPAAAAPEKKICKQLPGSYTRMTKRACLTEKEWKQVEQDTQD